MYNPVPSKKAPPAIAALLGATLFFATGARAADCDALFNNYQTQIDALKTQQEKAATDTGKALFDAQIASMVSQAFSAKRQCEADNKSEQDKKDKDAKKLADAKADCDKKAAAYGADAYQWKNDKCVNNVEKAANKSPTETGDCSSASVFNGDLKGQNCKKAYDVVKDVKARNGALTDATTAATAAYGSMQATGATGAQDDAQTRQANIMKTLAVSKFLTGALNLQGAMQLKSAAAGAEDANSTITGAQKQIQQACSEDPDEQSCFFKNAGKYGITPDQRNYASFARMKQAAQQSQDQADAANALAKSSLMTGAADMLVGLQAMKAAQMAQNNAGAMAPPPMPGMAPPPNRVNFGDASGGPGAPSLAPGVVPPPTDYGNPGAGGDPFGGQHHGHIDGTMAAAHMGVPNIFKGASSGVSGGGGGGGIGGGGLRSSPGRNPAARRNQNAGEYNIGAGGAGFKGGSAAAAEKENPLAEMLAKMFPQGQDGKPVVDARQVASATGGTVVEEENDPAVTASDLSIFEQITAKYRQLNGSGRF